MPAQRPVVYDVNVLIDAVAGGKSDFYTWPTLPATTKNSAADCIGVANDNFDFSLWLSPHILDNAHRVLIEHYQIDAADVDEYLSVIEEIAIASGGEIVEPARTVTACQDHEDNLILDLAVHSGAVLVVSNDTDLTAMSPWRGTPILRPYEFAEKVDGMRRAQALRPEKQSTSQRLLQQQNRRAARSAATEFDLGLTTFDQGEFDQLHTNFEQLYDQLVTVVDSWNPHNPAMKAKIDRWNQHLLTLDKRAKDITELAKEKPELAQSSLETLNMKLDTALDHLDPQRCRQPSAIGDLAAQSPSLPESTTTSHEHEDAGYEP